MKGKIDQDGFLWIWRGKEFKRQECCYGGGACGDFCPRFSEPYKDVKVKEDIVCVAVCDGVYWGFQEFEDERV